MCVLVVVGVVVKTGGQLNLEESNKKERKMWWEWEGSGSGSMGVKGPMKMQWLSRGGLPSNAGSHRNTIGRYLNFTLKFLFMVYVLILLFQRQGGKSLFLLNLAEIRWFSLTMLKFISLYFGLSKIRVEFASQHLISSPYHSLTFSPEWLWMWLFHLFP